MAAGAGARRSLIGMMALSYWSIRRTHVHVVSPGQHMATGFDDYGLIIELDVNRAVVPWRRIAAARERRGIALLTITGPEVQILLPAELLPDELHARLPARARNQRRVWVGTKCPDRRWNIRRSGDRSVDGRG